jgi:excisionase family DNA binding protein
MAAGATSRVGDEGVSVGEAPRLLDESTLTIAEAVKFTGLPRTNLYELMGSGRLPYVKIGKRRLVPRKALVGLLNKNLVGGESN